MTCQFVRPAAVKKLVKEILPGARVSGDFLRALDSMVRNKIEWSVTLPMNKRTVKDIIPQERRSK